MLVTLLAPAAARAEGPAALAAELQRAMGQAGTSSGAYVYDVSTGQALFADRETVARSPASVEKLYTSFTAVQRMGPDARLTTKVLGTGFKDVAGIWHGNLYLRGDGDPTFGSSHFIAAAYGGQGASVSALARQLANAGITRVAGRVLGDESKFDTARFDPSNGYAFDPDLGDPFSFARLSGLAFDRGQSGSQRGTHAPAAYAAQQLAGALRKAGIAATGAGAAASTPTGATPLASVQSPTLATLLGLMLPESDNYFAEMLIKDIGAQFGGAGTTSAGAAVVRRTLAALGVHPHVVDGSGLSRADRTSPLDVVTVLRALSSQPLGQVVRANLAVVGRSGTLAHRMRGTAAAGRCQAKSGTLTFDSDLAGWCDTAGGDTVVFAFLMGGIDLTTAHVVQDNMTISVARLSSG